MKRIAVGLCLGLFLLCAHADVSTALEASHIFRAKPGYLIDVTITNTNSSAQWILLIDSATLPSDGTVTFLSAPLRVAGTSTTMKVLPSPAYAANGIVICNSSTAFSGTTPTKTIGAADCFFEAHTK